MNQWILAFLIFWLGTGALAVANNFVNISKERARERATRLAARMRIEDK